MTGSVPSTQAIFIVPSGTSSRPIRSIRRSAWSGCAASVTRTRSGRGRNDRAAGPLVLEEVADAVLDVGQRDPRHDGLQEAQDDELAGLVVGDAAVLEVEHLALVDRPDRRRVGGAAAIGLIDLERRDGDRTRLLGQVHPELAEEAVGPDGAAVDRDQALHERPRVVAQGTLRQEVTGGVPAAVPGVRGQVEQLPGAAEHDLGLVDGRAISRQHVVDPRPDEPAAQLGERPAQARTLADLRLPVAEGDLVRYERLERRYGDLGIPADRQLRGAREQRLARADGRSLRAGGQLLLDERQGRSVADA